MLPLRFKRLSRRPFSPIYRPSCEELESRRLLTSLSTTVWTSLGPQPVVTGTGALAGRLNVAVADPTDPNVMYVGGDGSAGCCWGSGIWKTTNWLAPIPEWTSLIDAQPSEDIYYHGLAMAPTNHNVLYAAANAQNGGILRTADGGQTWRFLARDLFANSTFGAIAVSPLNENIVYVAVNGSIGGKAAPGGLYRSVDGGNRWVNLTPPSFGPLNVSDLALDPTNPNLLYAGVVGAQNSMYNSIYQITDLAFGDPFWSLQVAVSDNSSDYIQLAIAPSNPGVVYATFLDPGTSSSPASLIRYRREPTLGSWSQLPLPPAVGGSAAFDYRTWHVVLGVDSQDENTIYVNGGEPNLFRGAVDAGTGSVTWSLINNQEDHVEVSFDTTGAVVLVSDRGILRSVNPTNLSAVWQDKRQTLNTVLFYDIAVNPDDPSIVYGVAQDQFNLLQTTSLQRVWQYLNSGSEIGTVLVNPLNPRIVYNLSQGDANPSGLGLVARSVDGGANFQATSAPMRTGSLSRIGCSGSTWTRMPTSARCGLATRTLGTAVPRTTSPASGRSMRGRKRAPRTASRGTGWTIFSASTPYFPLFCGKCRSLGLERGWPGRWPLFLRADARARGKLSTNG